MCLCVYTYTLSIMPAVPSSGRRRDGSWVCTCDLGLTRSVISCSPRAPRQRHTRAVPASHAPPSCCTPRTPRPTSPGTGRPGPEQRPSPWYSKPLRRAFGITPARNASWLSLGLLHDSLPHTPDYIHYLTRPPAPWPRLITALVASFTHYFVYTALSNLVVIWPRPAHAAANPLGRGLRDPVGQEALMERSPRRHLPFWTPSSASASSVTLRSNVFLPFDIHQGRQLQFRCTLRCQGSPTGLRAAWPPAPVASPTTQHAVRNDQSLMREALLRAFDVGNALLRGSISSLHRHSHQALTSVIPPPNQRPDLSMLHPARPPRVQRTVASATTLRECTCHRLSFGGPTTWASLGPKAVGCPHLAHGLRWTRNWATSTDAPALAVTRRTSSRTSPSGSSSCPSLIFSFNDGHFSWLDLLSLFFFTLVDSLQKGLTFSISASGTVFGHATFCWTEARKKAGTRPRKKYIYIYIYIYIYVSKS